MSSKEKTIFFIAGMPRSGSTLLCNILNQNPEFRVTPTNGLVNILNKTRNEWFQNEAFQAQELDVIDNIRGMLRGMLYGYHSVGDEPYVFDKSRLWPQDIVSLEDIVGKRVKIIFPVRNVNEVIVSFEKKARQANLLTTRDTYLRERVNNWLDPKGIVGSPIELYREAAITGYADRFLIIPYPILLNDPMAVFTELHVALDVPQYKYDFDNVNQQIWENDLFYRFSSRYALHKVKNNVMPYVKPDYTEYLPQNYIDDINENYADMNDLADISNSNSTSTSSQAGLNFL